MLWPLVLPIQITSCILAAVIAVIAVVTVISPIRKWGRPKTFAVLTIISFVSFIPSCVGVTSIVDAYRFGTFQYASFTELQDFRVERFVPKKARNITVNKYAMGHKAKYTISESELKSYLDQLWDAHGKQSAIPRKDLENDAVVAPEDIKADFSGLDWPVLENAVEYHSPVEADGGGATYYFSRESSIVYHRAGYW
ncbi:MAG: hypothetical protein R3C17_21720 [Planctomycetaceae bacterium]